MQQPLRRWARSALHWVALESVGVFLLSLIGLVIVARLVGPTQFGLASIAISITSVLEFAILAPFQEALIQRRHLTPNLIGTAFWSLLALSFAALVICIVAANPIAALYGLPELATLLPLSALTCITTALNCVPVVLLIRNLRAADLATRTLVSRSAGVLTAWILAERGWGSHAVVLGSVAAGASGSILLWYRGRHSIEARPSLTDLRSLLSFGWYRWPREW